MDWSVSVGSQTRPSELNVWMAKFCQHEIDLFESFPRYEGFTFDANFYDKILNQDLMEQYNGFSGSGEANSDIPFPIDNVWSFIFELFTQFSYILSVILPIFTLNFVGVVDFQTFLHGFAHSFQELYFPLKMAIIMITLRFFPHSN